MRSRLNKNKKQFLAAVFVVSSWWVLPGFAQEDFPIAGTQPERRPENAPVITTVDKPDTWYQQALTGIQPPYPNSISDFLEDQGNWHTPFNQPGMTGPYDLRGWHLERRIVCNRPHREMRAWQSSKDVLCGYP